jgi:NADH dehydrogenase FAD-containing subunit
VVDQTRITAYDSLVVAAGSGQSYFGNDQFARFAPGMALDQLGEQFSPTLSPRPGQDPRS